MAHFGEFPSVGSEVPSVDGKKSKEIVSDDEEKTPVAKMCRICHEEGDVNKLIAPCDCSGSMKMVHKECIEKWCWQKENSNCEICNKPYNVAYGTQGPPFLPPIPSVEEIARHIRAEPASFTLVLADALSSQLFDGGVDELATPEGARNAFIRIAVLFPLAFLVLKILFDLVDRKDESFFNQLHIFALRVMAVIAPLYMCLYFMHLWFRRRQRIETTLLKAEIARMIRAQHIRRRLEMLEAAGYHATFEDLDNAN